MSRHLFGILLLCGLWGGWLADVAEATTSTDKELRRLYRQSRKQVRRGRYEKAEVHLQTGIILIKRTLKQSGLSSTARARYGRGLFRFSIALAVTYYRFMKRYPQAYDVLESLRNTSLSPKQRTIYEHHLKRIAPQVKTAVVLRIDPKYATLRLRHKAGWTLTQKAPLRQSLWPGQWQVEIKAPGFQTYQLSLKLKPGGFLKRQIRLLQSQPHGVSRLALYSTPAHIKVTLSHPTHGSCTGQTPLFLKMKPGTWKLSAQHPKHKAFQGQLQIGAQRQLQRTLVLQPKGTQVVQAMAWTTLGVAIVMGSSGVLLTYFAQKEFNALLALPEPPPDSQARYDAAVSMQIWGYVTFGLAGAALISSGSLFAYMLLRPAPDKLHPIQPPRPWRSLRACRSIPARKATTP